jgi:hypothetical protein
MLDESRRVLTEAEAAERLGIALSTLRRWRSRSGWKRGPSGRRLRDHEDRCTKKGSPHRLPSNAALLRERPRDEIDLHGRKITRRHRREKIRGCASPSSCGRCRASIRTRRLRRS